MTVEQIECTKAMFRGKTVIVFFLFACGLFVCDLLTVGCYLFDHICWWIVVSLYCLKIFNKRSTFHTC